MNEAEHVAQTLATRIADLEIQNAILRARLDAAQASTQEVQDG